ncbi:MAG: metallophosphoesterase family protein [Paludibacteraceae bacterium]|nr:metallophosphoesterase family protein [Paludibacteraceae bacterium]
MKKIYSLLMVSCMVFFAACKPDPVVEPDDPKPEPKDSTEQIVPKTEWEMADSLYTVADYTVPSHTMLKIAIQACTKDSSEANKQALRQAIKNLVPKTEPYCMIANINGDPKTRMGFAWFTNDGVTDGEVQIVAVENAKEADFESGNVITVPAGATQTKSLRYSGKATYIVNKSGIKASVRYKYTSHKAVATDLTPGTAYSWRCGYEGHWSPIGHFRTEDAAQGEFSFIYMTDSHIMNETYIKEARRCALAAVKTVPDARFCVFPGDFVEDGDANNSEWEWERWFEEALEPVIKTMPMAVTDGNHDDSPNINYTYHFNTDNWFNYNITNKPQFEGIVYNFVYGDVLFLVFSMQDFWRESYDQVARTWSTYLDEHVSKWFRQTVIENPDTKYRISLAHFNLFSGSDHSTDEEPPLFRACMLPTFKACEIDIALQGHDHTYEVIGPVNPDDCTPILSAISDVEEVAVDRNKNMTGKKGGTFCTDDGTFYFIGATCGHKRYYPHSRERMEDDYAEDIETIFDNKHHNVKNYFDLFTGMFGQPEKPSFTKITVKSDCIEFNSYTADDDEGNVTLFNTMKVVRNKAHGVPTPGL